MPSSPNPPSSEETSKETSSSSTWQKGQSQFSNKRYSEYFDPCQEAANKSLKCLRRNGGDREMCQDYFEAYKECKKNWMEEMKEEKRKNSKSWF